MAGVLILLAQECDCDITNALLCYIAHSHQNSTLKILEYEEKKQFFSTLSILCLVLDKRVSSPQ